MTGAAHDNNWMPLYIGDYLRDTTRLTVAEHGAYLLLIMDYWVNGPPPDDDRELARIARTPLNVWRRYRRGQLIKMFTCEGGTWIHKRVEIERERARQFNEQKRNGGRASVSSRRAKKGSAQPEHRSDPENAQTAPKTATKSNVSPEHRSERVRGSVRTQGNQDTDLRFKNLKGDLGSASEATAPPEPPSAEDLAAVETMLATMALPPGSGLRRGVYDEAAYRQAITDHKRDTWLNNLAAFVGEALPGLPEKMAAWEAIEKARNAGSRNATPPDVRRAVDALSRMREQSGAYAEAAE